MTTRSSSCFDGTRERRFTNHRHCRPSVSSTRGRVAAALLRAAWRGVVADDRLGAGKTPPGAPGLGRCATKSCNILKATDHCFFRCLNRDYIRPQGTPEKPPVQPSRRHRPQPSGPVSPQRRHAAASAPGAGRID